MEEPQGEAAAVDHDVAGIGIRQVLRGDVRLGLLDDRMDRLVTARRLGCGVDRLGRRSCPHREARLTGPLLQLRPRLFFFLFYRQLFLT